MKLELRKFDSLVSLVKWQTILLILFLLSGCSILEGERKLGLRARPTYYFTKSGDTLLSVSAKFDVDVEKIAMLNGIKDLNVIKSGVRLYLGYKDPATRSAVLASNSNSPRGSSSSTSVRPASINIPRGKGRIGWPLKGKVRISSKFGRRNGSFHDGIDFAAPRGTPIYASHSGKVVYSNNKLRGYGNLVIVRADSGLTTVYAHNRRNLVRNGTRVSKGQKIAEIGSTGRSSGPHLHFEVRDLNSRGQYLAVDPLPLLSGKPQQKPSFRVNERLTPIIASAGETG